MIVCLYFCLRCPTRKSPFRLSESTIYFHIFL